MDSKLLNIFFLVMICGVYLGVEAVPAYPQNNFNSWDTQYTPQQTPRRNNSPKPFQTLVREHLNDLDKDKQTDVKVLSYFEKEMNKIFSCYLRLSCYKTRSAKALAECDEIKDWPLYHQVMKMAGITKYPYRSYAPTQKNLDDLTPSTDFGTDDNAEEDSAEPEIEYVRPIRQNRRIRREHQH